MKKGVFIILVVAIFASCGNSQSNTEKTDDTQTNEDFLVLDQESEAVIYRNSKGEAVIENENYLMAFTDTLRKMAIVLDMNEGFIGIDNQGKKLFDVFQYDNGPDYVEDGLFRILKDDKIGYADLEGNIVIEPQFSCAYPFYDGKAKVSINCKSIADGEHTIWESEDWFFINKKGEKVE